MSDVRCQMLNVEYHMSNVECQMSWHINVNVKCYGIPMSNVMAYQCQMSNVMEYKCQMSNVKSQMIKYQMHNAKSVDFVRSQ